MSDATRWRLRVLHHAYAICAQRLRSVEAAIAAARREGRQHRELSREARQRTRTLMALRDAGHLVAVDFAEWA